MDERVLLVEDDPSIREVTALGLRGSGLRVDTAADGQEALARFRAQPVAFVSVADQTAGAEPKLHVADFSTGANRPLADLDAGHVRHIVWSPDGSQVLVVAGGALPHYASLNPLVSPQETSLTLVATDGSGIREIASGHYVATAWSPDGTQIAAIEYSSRGRQLVVLNADGSGKRVLVKLPAGELFTGVAWHPLPDES